MAHGGTGNPDHRVAPAGMILIELLVPLVRDSGTADESNLSVDNQQLAMRAIVVARELVPAGRVIPGKLPAGSCELVKILFVGPHAAERIEYDIYAHAGPGTFRQSIDVASGNLALPPDVGFKTHRPLCGGD